MTRILKNTRRATRPFILAAGKVRTYHKTRRHALRTALKAGHKRVIDTNRKVVVPAAEIYYW